MKGLTIILRSSWRRKTRTYILRKRAKHYFKKNQIASSKLQEAKSRLETIVKKKEGEKLEILAEASLIA